MVVGSVRELMARVLDELIRPDLIDMGSQGITLLDPQALFAQKSHVLVEG